MKDKLSDSSDSVNKMARESEEKFLASYDIEDYDRPSVAVDMTMFSMFAKEADCHRRDSEAELSVLLIKRGEHPYINQWALPGGFLRKDETIEECVEREIKEETNLTPSAIIPIGVFSNPERDPRGRILSNSFASVICEENVGLAGGGDAIDAKWFFVKFAALKNGNYELVLSNNEAVLSAELKKSESRYVNKKFEIISNDHIAFDHAKIIATAIDELESRAEDFDIIFEFLPEKFTLAALQQVQEKLLGTSLLTANFRRKVTSLVEETEEFTEGVGHRPARLFKRKMK